MLSPILVKDYGAELVGYINACSRRVARGSPGIEEDDLLAVAWTRVMAEKGNREYRSSELGYLKRTARNAIFDHLRSEKRHTRNCNPLHEEKEQGLEVAESHMAQYLRQSQDPFTHALRTAIMGVLSDPDEQDLVWLHAAEGYSFGELAPHFGIPKSSLHSKYQQAEAKIRAGLGISTEEEPAQENKSVPLLLACMQGVLELTWSEAPANVG